MNLDEMRYVSDGLDKQKQDYTAPLRFNQQSCWLKIGGNLFNEEIELPMTDHALSQACGRLKIPPYSYMRECPADLRASNLNHWADNTQYLIREFNGSARAVLSTAYVPISNTQVLDIALEILDGTMYTPWDEYITSDTLHVRLSVSEDRIDWADGWDVYRAGVYIGNGEIGNRSVRILPFIQRTSCTNSTIWREGGFVQKHIHTSFEHLRVNIKHSIAYLFGQPKAMIEAMMKAEADEIDNPAETIKAILRAKGLTAYEDYAMIGMEGKRSKAGVIHGITYAAKYAGNEDVKADMEVLAGAYLMGDPLPDIQEA